MSAEAPGLQEGLEELVRLVLVVTLAELEELELWTGAYLCIVPEFLEYYIKE